MARNAVVHIEWQSTDFEKVKKFYGGLFEWEFTPWGKDYLLFKPKNGVAGGFQKTDKVVSGESPTVYVEVQHINPYLEKAKTLGGKVIMERTVVPNAVTMAVVADLDGNMVGLVEEDMPA